MTDMEFYPPCEAIFTELDLEQGVIQYWHKYISPLDRIPMVYKYKCLECTGATRFTAKHTAKCK